MQPVIKFVGGKGDNQEKHSSAEEKKKMGDRVTLAFTEQLISCYTAFIKLPRSCQHCL